jgi:hypothetical protein
MKYLWKIAGGLAVMGIACALFSLHPVGGERESKELTYHGKPLTDVLRNDIVSGKTQLTLDEMLTLKQIITGAEPQVVTFELPINYDVITKIGSLCLSVDPDGFSRSDPEGVMSDCVRGTNGNCLMGWNTAYDPPGQHALQAQLSAGRTGPVKGPVFPFLSSNLCRFQLFHANYNYNKAFLYAKLPKSNGIYTIELKSLAGDHVKTFTETTSNGEVMVEWDLKDDSGKACTNDSLESYFTITLPASDRKQMLKYQANRDVSSQINPPAPVERAKKIADESRRDHAP